MDFSLRTITTPSGDIHIALPTSGDDLYSYCIEEQGRWFEPEIDLIQNCFPEGGSAIDVGANVGAYSLGLALRAKTRGKVWAFEPDPRPRAYLEQSKEQNHFDNLHIQAMALGETYGEAPFIFATESVLSHLGQTGETGACRQCLRDISGRPIHWPFPAA